MKLGRKSPRKSPRKLSRRFAVCPLTKIGTRAGRGRKIIEPGNRVAAEIDQRIWVENRVKIRDEIQTKTRPEIGVKIGSEKILENTPEMKAYTTQKGRSRECLPLVQCLGRKVGGMKRIFREFPEEKKCRKQGRKARARKVRKRVQRRVQKRVRKDVGSGPGKQLLKTAETRLYHDRVGTRPTSEKAPGRRSNYPAVVFSFRAFKQLPNLSGVQPRYV